MSVTVVIKEGGLGKSLTVDKLKTNVSGGGTQLWIPEKNMTTKTITENGTYEAKDDDVPGWDKVIVNVAGGEGGSITGHDPDTGEDVNVSVDPETGDIVETVVPSSIRITTPPAKTTYNDGETINYSGIVVHGYSKTGQDLGVIPYNKLVFPVKKASEGGDEDWTDGSGIHAKKIVFMPKPGTDVYGHEITVYVAPVMGVRSEKEVAYGSFSAPYTILITRYNSQNYGLMQAGLDNSCEYFMAGKDVDGLWNLVGSNSGFNADGAFHAMIWSQYLTDVPISTVDPTTADPSTLHGGQSIPVQYARSGDGKVLEDSFPITVN